MTWQSDRYKCPGNPPGSTHVEQTVAVDMQGVYMVNNPNAIAASCDETGEFVVVHGQHQRSVWRAMFMLNEGCSCGRKHRPDPEYLANCPDDPRAERRDYRSASLLPPYRPTPTPYVFETPPAPRPPRYPYLEDALEPN